MCRSIDRFRERATARAAERAGHWPPWVSARRPQARGTRGPEPETTRPPQTAPQTAPTIPAPRAPGPPPNPVGSRTSPAASAPAALAPAVVARAATGEPAALREVFAAVHPLVLAYCRARLGGGAGVDSPEDVAQTVCLNLLGALPRYRDTGSPFLAYVYTCAGNAVTDAWRRAARRPSDPVPDPPEIPDPRPGPEDRGAHLEVARRTRELLDTLPDRMREVLVLRVALGLSTRQTAELVGLSESTVRVVQHRALARLRAA